MAKELGEVFERLRAIYRRCEARCVVLADEPGRYSLGTQHVREKDGYRTWFGGVEIKKRYVAAHLMPVYVSPELLEEISPALKKRMQVKACFNFARADAVLFDELEALVAAGERQFASRGWLR
jgi:hypothetical protein